MTKPLEKVCGNCVSFNGPSIVCDMVRAPSGPDYLACRDFEAMGKPPGKPAFVCADCAGVFPAEHKPFLSLEGYYLCAKCWAKRNDEEGTKELPKTCLSCHYFFAAGRACAYYDGGTVTVNDPSKECSCPHYKPENETYRNSEDRPNQGLYGEECAAIKTEFDQAVGALLARILIPKQRRIDALEKENAELRAALKKTLEHASAITKEIGE